MQRTVSAGGSDVLTLPSFTNTSRMYGMPKVIIIILLLGLVLVFFAHDFAIAIFGYVFEHVFELNIGLRLLNNHCMDLSVTSLTWSERHSGRHYRSQTTTKS
jgi:uncharacterized integral membrane protein